MSSIKFIAIYYIVTLMSFLNGLSCMKNKLCHESSVPGLRWGKKNVVSNDILTQT